MNPKKYLFNRRLAGFTSTVALLGVLALGQTAARAKTYYSSTTGAINPGATASWWTANNGTGTHPANFTTSGDIFEWQAGPTAAALGADWTLGSGVNLVVDASATLSILGTGTVTIGGTTTVNGTLNKINSGLFTLSGAVTVNSGGTFGGGTGSSSVTFGSDVSVSGTGAFTEFAGAESFTFGGNLTVDSTATFTTTGQTGNNTFTGSGTTISGTMTFPNMVVNGTCQNNGTVTATLTLSGTGTLTQGANSVLKITGTSTITALTATASPNTVNYNGAAQTVKGTTYNNLTLSGSNTKTLGGGTVISGTMDVQSPTTLNFAGYNVTDSGGASVFQVDSGATLQIKDANGITSSGASGNVQTTTRNFNTGANYTYSGSVAQVTGSGLPATVSKLIINNTAGVNLSGNVTVTGLFTLTAGTFAIGANTLALNGGATFTVQTLTGGSTSSLIIGGSAANYTLATGLTSLNNLTLTGGTAASVTVNAGLTCAGSATIGSGTTLALGASGSIATTTITDNGTFDVSAIGGYHLTTGQALSGTGTVTGPITVDPVATLTVGGSTGTTMGTLTVNGGLTLNGNTTLRLNKGGGTTSDLITWSSGTVTFGGTLNLSSVGTALTIGDTFTIFASGGSGSFTSLSPLSPGGGLAWDTSSLGSGVIGVIAATGRITPTPATLTSPLTTTYGTPSSPQTVTITSSGLSDNITAYAPVGLEVSSDNITYGATATLPSTGGTLYVRLSATATVAGSPYDSRVIGLGSGSTANTFTTSASGNTVARLALTIDSPVAQNKLYDGGTAATITGTLNGVLPADAANVTLNGTGTFNNAGPSGGTPIAVTANCTPGGSAGGNYTISPQPTGLSAYIYATAVWISTTSGGNWSDTGNWQNGMVANGSFITPDFTTLDITADTTVHLDASETVNGLSFGDTDTNTAASWVLDDNGSSGVNKLTLAGTTPTITVNALGAGSSATISAAIAGNVPLTKAGPGTLTLSGTNTFGAGNTFELKNGTLNINGTKALGSATTTFQIDGGTMIDNTSGATVALANNQPWTINGNFTYGGTYALIAGSAISKGGAVTLNGSYGVTCNGSTTLTIAGIISDGGHNYSFTKDGDGSLTFANTNHFTGGLIIKNGIVRGLGYGDATGNSLGALTSTVTLGDASTDASGASLLGSAFTYPNPITVIGNTHGGALTIGGQSATANPTWGGAITLDTSTSPTLTISLANQTTAGNNTTVTNGITGTGNLILDASCGAGNNTITLSGAPINNIGTIVNQATTSTGATTISANIGANVTGVTQNSATSALILSGTNAFNGGLFIKNGTVSGTTTATVFGGSTGGIANAFGTITLGDASTLVTGASLWGSSQNFANPITVVANANGGPLTISAKGTTAAATFSGPVTLSGTPTLTIANISAVTSGSTTISGGISNAGNLVLDNNAASGTINLSTAMINNGGTITAQGSSTGTNTIAAQIGSAVTGITQNSSSSTLVLSGVNAAGTFNGNMTISAGTLKIGGAGQLNGSNYSGNVSDSGIFNYGSSASQTMSGIISGGSGALTVSGTGTLTLTGPNSYGGATTVSLGRLVVSSAQTGTGAISVADGASLGVTLSGASQLAPTTLTVGTTAGATLEFNGVDTATAPLNPGTLTANGTVTITVNSASGRFVKNSTYPLLSWTTGSAPATSLNTASLANAGTTGHLITNSSPNLIALVVDSASDIWTGTGTSGYWDIGTTANWTSPGGLFANGDNVLFDDTAAGTTNVTVRAAVQPASMTVNNSALAYTITSSGGNNIGGSAATLTKTGNGTLTLNGPNSYNGGTTVNAGVVDAQNSSALGGGGASVTNSAVLQVDGNGLNLGNALTLSGTGISSGGALRNLANANTCSGNITLGSAARINSDAGTLTLNSATAISGATFGLTLGGSGNISIPSAIATTTGTLTKDGSGTATLSGANTYSGATTVSAGTLKNGSSSAFTGNGSLTVTNAGIFDLNGYNATFASVTAGVNTGIITDNSSGSGTSTLTVTNWSGTLANLITDGANGQKVAVVIAYNANQGPNSSILLNSPNTFSGGLTLGNGLSGGFAGTAGRTRLYVSTTNVLTTLDGAGHIVSSPFGRGTITIGQAATDPAAMGFAYTTNPVSIYNNITVNTALGTDVPGAFRINAANTVLFYGTLDAYLAPATFTGNGAGATVILAGQVTGNSGLVIRTNNAAGQIISLVLSNVTANANNYAGDTVINPYGQGACTLAMGAANQIPNGSGAGNITNNGTMALNGFSQTLNGLNGSGVVDGISGTPAFTLGGNNASGAFSGVIQNTGGTLSLAKTGTGTQTLSGANTYTGNTVISGGTLALAGTGSINNTAGIAIAAGTTFDVSALPSFYALSTNLSAGGAASPAIINGPAGGIVILGALPINLTIDGVANHPALTVTNAATLAVNGNAISVTNAGSALPTGTYHLIQLNNGATSGISGATPVLKGGVVNGSGVASGGTPSIAVNNGYVDLVVASSSTASNPTNIMFSVDSGVLKLGWPLDHKGWLVQSNSLDLGNTNAWHDIAGTDAGTNYNVTLNPAQTNVFYRLRHP